MRCTGRFNWFDEAACACGEMVFEVIDALNVPLTVEVANPPLYRHPDRHGRFPVWQHHGPHLRDLQAGARRRVRIRPLSRARFTTAAPSAAFRLMGGVLHNLELESRGRLAVADMSLQLIEETGSTQEDSDG